MKTVTLTEQQCYTISSYLRTSVQRFDEFAKAVRESDDPAVTQSTRAIAEQFAKQSREANQLADIFENAASASVEKNDEA